MAKWSEKLSEAKPSFFSGRQQAIGAQGTRDSGRVEGCIFLPTLFGHAKRVGRREGPQPLDF